jgi:hypothetical protein
MATSCASTLQGPSWHVVSADATLEQLLVTRADDLQALLNTVHSIQQAYCSTSMPGCHGGLWYVQALGYGINWGVLLWTEHNMACRSTSHVYSQAAALPPEYAAVWTIDTTTCVQAVWINVGDSQLRLKVSVITSGRHPAVVTTWMALLNWHAVACLTTLLHRACDYM